MRAELLTAQRRFGGQKTVIAEQRFLPVLLLRLADDVVEDPGIVVDGKRSFAALLIGA